MYGKVTSRVIAALFVTTLAFISASADAAIYLNAGTIKGDATATAFKDQIEILSMQFGVTHPGSETMAKGAPVGKAQFGDVTLTKHADGSSAALMQAASSGQVLPKMVLTIAKADSGPATTFTLSNVFVSGYSYSDSGSTAPGTETVTLNYSKVQWQFAVPNGKAPASGSWDIANAKM
jgi:type VI secretion system secreted protein Hcp